jgi:hypothetical protein
MVQVARGNQNGYVSGGFVPPTGAEQSPLNLLPAQDNAALVVAINRLNAHIEKGIVAKATINKYGHNGLDEALSDITKFNSITK